MSKNTAAEPEATDRNTEIALFRYGLIAQLVHTPPDQGHQEALLREIAARPFYNLAFVKTLLWARGHTDELHCQEVEP
jgi:hypothetical protein